ncbi:MAG TPA: polysaccharide biosynthesis C-terminal domain-containing protein [Candidatus Hypogeohydataceae bacterium YC41]
MQGIEIKDLKVLQDHRGWFVELFRKEFGIEKIAQVNLTVATPGMVKGNHYHLHKTEWYCVIKGRMKLVLEDIDNRKTSEITLGDDELRVVKVPPRVIHGFKNIGEGDMYLIYSTDISFEPRDTDTFPQAVIS